MSSLWIERERAAPSSRREESHRSPAPARPRLPSLAGDRTKADGKSSPVLAMLARRGFAPAQIAAAASGARGQGVTVADYLIGNGYVRADTLYRLIAEHLGLPFLGATIPLRENIDPHP